MLNELQLAYFERLLCENLENLCVELTTWKDGFFTSRVGTVNEMDSYEKTIILQDELNKEIKIDSFKLSMYKQNNRRP